MLGVNLLEVIMVKKFSYLVSVSVLASSLLSSTSHANIDRELREHIDGFQAYHSRVALPSAPVSSSSSTDEESSSWWDTASTAGKSLLSATCHSLRCAGDYVRRLPSDDSSLAKSSLSFVGTLSYNGVNVDQITSSIASDPSRVEMLLNATGNSLRWLGERGVGETPTLARAIYDFWDAKKVRSPEDAFPITAHALYLTPGFNLREIKLHFYDFADKWDVGSQTSSHKCGRKKDEYFLRGIIRGLISENNDSDFITSQINTLGVIFVPDPEQQARRDAFISFARRIYDLESQVEVGEQSRQRFLQSAPLADSVPSALPAPDPHSSGDGSE